MIRGGYVKCDCDFYEDQGAGLCDCGHDPDQHNMGNGDECLAQEGDPAGSELPALVLESLRATTDSEPELYRVVLTEDGYTTAEGPMPKAEAQALYDQVGPMSPTPGSRLTLVTETEYQASQVGCAATAPYASETDHG
jgi:hypothetical protein